MFPMMLERWPQLKGTRITHAWTGNVAFAGAGDAGRCAAGVQFDTGGVQLGRGLTSNDGFGVGTDILINIHGSTVDFGNHGYTGFDVGEVLFNLPDAESVRLNGGINASLLALRANVGPGWGQINGQVVVQDWNSSVQVNDAPLPPFTRPSLNITQPLPEPASIALVALALGTAGLARRRKR